MSGWVDGSAGQTGWAGEQEQSSWVLSGARGGPTLPPVLMLACCIAALQGNEFGHPEWIDFPRDDT